MKIEHRADEIISMYVDQGLNTVRISEIIGCSSSGVENLLKRNGIKMSLRYDRLGMKEPTTSEICQRYINGETTIEIGKEFNLCDRTIAKILRRNGVELRVAARRSNIPNHRFFECIDSPEKAYFLGWMLTDGSIVVPKSRPDRSPIISLEIQSKDAQVLYKFAECLGADRSVVKHNTKRSHSYLRFASSEMASDLARYGVVPNKALITYLPRIDDELMPHLIRGIFDGDGTATIDKRNGHIHFAFYGSEQICYDLRNYLHDKIGLNANKVSKSTCHHVWWGGTTPARLFANYIYSNCEGLALERKKNIFTNHNDYHGNTEITGQIA